MKERALSFNAPMVRAILDGRKTQTRRIADGVTACSATGYPYWPGSKHGGERVRVGHCPYGKPGDRLWVRENWRTGVALDTYSPKKMAESCLEWGWPQPWAPLLFEADDEKRAEDTLSNFGGNWGKSRPSSHMPRWASRITLEVTAVRVECLQDISEADAIAEGISGWVHDERCETAVDGFRILWDSTYGQQRNRETGGHDSGPHCWQANPWVWVIEFKVVQL